MKANIFMFFSILVVGASLVSFFGLEVSKNFFNEFVVTEIGIGMILFVSYMWLVRQNYNYIKNKSRVYRMNKKVIPEVEMSSEERRAA